MTIANWWRIRTGRPMLWPTDRELRWALARQDAAEVRRVQAELDQLARDAQEYDLPMPFPPSRVLNGFIISGQP